MRLLIMAKSSVSKYMASKSEEIVDLSGFREVGETETKSPRVRKYSSKKSFVNRRKSS